MRNQCKRCSWCGDDPLYQDYHDHEWGVPLRDSQPLFEFLILEGMQAGLSWITVLKKREAFRLAFSQFDPYKVARFSEKKQEALMHNAGIIRNRLKIKAAVNNAKLVCELEEKGQHFKDVIWQFTDNKTIQNNWRCLEDIPSSTDLSDAMSKTLKKIGFKFIGSTICYAFMQATGMVNDHVVSCFRHHELLL